MMLVFRREIRENARGRVSEPLPSWLGKNAVPPSRMEETTRERKVLRRYTQVVGVGLLLLGGACMLGVGTTNPLVDLDHLFVGGLLAYAGFGHRDEAFVRTIVWGIGVIYMLAGLLAFVVPALFGVFPDTPNGIFLNHLVHLVLGVSSLAAAAFLRQDMPAKR